jgi:hypothetical protein
MISMARIFGAPETVPAGKHERKASIAEYRSSSSVPSTWADDMHDVREPFDLHELRNVHRARLGHPSDVVAPEVDEHDVFGKLLFVGHQVDFKGMILASGRTAGSCSSNRVIRHDTVFESNQQFRRGTHYLSVTEVQIEHVRRGIHHRSAR